VLKAVPSPCDYTTLRSVTAGLHGEFTLTYAVRRDIVAYIAPTGNTTIDCASAAGACALTIQGTQSQPTTAIALGFDPSVPAVTPTISADPNTSLSDNQTVTVSLQGFTPNQPAQIIECSAEAVDETPNLGYCDYTTGQNVTPQAGPAFQTQFVVRSVIGGQGGLTDCTTRAGACVLVASANGGGGYYYGGLTTATTPSSAVPNVPFTPLTFATP
jgi:Neocarzinostatin family